MRVCIDSCLLGTDRHIVCDDARFVWTSTVPPDSWHLTGTVKPGHSRCLDTLLRLGQVAIDINPPERFVKATVPLLSGSNWSSHPPWHRMMPDAAYRDFVKTLVARAVEAVPSLPVNYYNDTWVPGNEVLGSLHRARIDRSQWQAAVDSGAGNLHALATFEPDRHGFAGQVSYNRFGTLTGRMTVASGPNILTLKKEQRGIIAPSTTGGRIMAIDFAALEPRILLYEAGRRCDEPDLYSHIAREVGDAPRQVVKGIVICELYGSSRHALAVRLNMGSKELDRYMARVRSYFNTSELLERIRAQFLSSGHIVNRYGRHVLIDEPLNHVMLNYYAQSTGVDVALLGFRQVIARLVESAPSVRPIFLLHDGLFLDVPADDVDVVKAINSVSVPGYVQKFHLTVSDVNVHA